MSFWLDDPKSHCHLPSPFQRDPAAPGDKQAEDLLIQGGSSRSSPWLVQQREFPGNECREGFQQEEEGERKNKKEMLRK